MDEFWKRVIYEDPGAEHVCEDFGVVLDCNGESDSMIRLKCGKSWIVPCRVKGKGRRTKAS